jgi:hypothetical protein
MQVTWTTPHCQKVIQCKNLEEVRRLAHAIVGRSPTFHTRTSATTRNVSVAFQGCTTTEVYPQFKTGGEGPCRTCCGFHGGVFCPLES